MKLEVFLPSEIIPEEPNTTIQLSQWLHNVGDHVEKGTDIAEVTTDKAVFVVSAPETGTIEQILVNEGENIDPKKPICILRTQ